MVGEAPGLSGTEVRFLPSKQTFTMTEFDFPTIERRLRELAFLNSGVRVVLTDARGVDETSVEFLYEGGHGAFFDWVDRAPAALHTPPATGIAERDGVTGASARQRNAPQHETMM